MNRLLLAGIAFGLLISSGCAAARDALGMASATPTATARPATPTPAPTATPEPKPVAIAKPAQATLPRELTLEVTEAELNEGLETMLVGQPLGTTPLGDATIQSISVTLRDGQMQVNGGATVGALSAPFAVVGQIAPDAAGRPKVTLTWAQVAGFIMPPPVVTGLSNVLQQQIDQVFSQQTMRVTSVEIADGRIRIVASQ